MIEDIRKNIDTEIEMFKELAIHLRRLKTSNQLEKRILTETIEALKRGMKIINSSIPPLLQEITIAKKMPATYKIQQVFAKTGKPKEKFEKVTYTDARKSINATILKKDRSRLLKELSISSSYLKRIKKKSPEEKEEYEEFKAARGYLKLSNKLFLNTAIKLINKGYFKAFSKELRKANMDILFPSYVAMILTTTLFSFFIGIFITVFFLFFNLNFDSPFISIYKGDLLLRLIQIIWVPLAIPILTFIATYYYPSTEKSTLAKRINQELPFAVVHMSSISGSGIHPSEIFKIIGLSKEYPYLRKEIRKILNQINLYGYDLVTALNNVASATPSPKLAELLSGLSTTIHSGGNLPNFFEKRAETLLSEYRIEREKYIKTAETYMDIYISIIIAAPMILMLLLVIMSVANFSIGFTTGQMAFLIILIITFLNILFLTFLHMSQPGY